MVKPDTFPFFVKRLLQRFWLDDYIIWGCKTIPVEVISCKKTGRWEKIARDTF